jgi:hypothetical protein
MDVENETPKFDSVISGYYKKRIFTLQNIFDKEQCQTLKKEKTPLCSKPLAQLLWEKIK